MGAQTAMCRAGGRPTTCQQRTRLRSVTCQKVSNRSSPLASKPSASQGPPDLTGTTPIPHPGPTRDNRSGFRFLPPPLCTLHHVPSVCPQRREAEVWFSRPSNRQPFRICTPASQPASQPVILASVQTPRDQCSRMQMGKKTLQETPYGYYDFIPRRSGAGLWFRRATPAARSYLTTYTPTAPTHPGQSTPILLPAARCGCASHLDLLGLYAAFCGLKSTVPAAFDSSTPDAEGYGSIHNY